jgi:hypothetical protein
MGVGGQLHDPAALASGTTRYPLYRRQGGHKGLFGRVGKISPPPGFDPHIAPTGIRSPGRTFPLLCNVKSNSDVKLKT